MLKFYNEKENLLLKINTLKKVTEMSKVYLARLSDDNGLDSEINKLSNIFTEYLSSCDDVAIKLHFGEEKSDTHLDPELVESIYNEIDTQVSNTVLMDCNVLYNSDRAVGSTHKELAKRNGFDFAPIVIADGEKGEEETEIPIGLNHFEEAKIGAALDNYGLLFGLSHFTGHDPAGFGGSLKNIGMGLGSKSGKLEMHEAFNLEIDESECTACGTCVQECPAGSLSIEEGSAVLDQASCIGCGMCIAVCPEGAFVIPWQDSSAEDLQERIVEYAHAVLKDRDAIFMNVLMDVTPDCDCVNKKQNPVMDDLGILISDDIVSIDQAGLDLTDNEKFQGETDPYIQVKYAEELGMGERDYELIEL